jgi:hypothetical protein
MKQTDVVGHDKLTEECSTHADYCRHMAERAGHSSFWARLAVLWTRLAAEARAVPLGDSEFPDATINELSELVAALLVSVRRLPPGPERYAALKQVGLFQVRLDAPEK